MPVIAVINRKGGSGKSTLATHLAAHCATQGLPVMLGDVDRQQSTRVWLRQREKQQPRQRAPIVGWTVDPKSVLRPPAGIRHVVLDTPGGLRGFDLARVVAFADAVLMPVCHSVFDRESAAECFAELMTLPRVASGRCKVAAIGMRVDARTKGADVLEAWAAERELPFVGVLRETQAYVRSVEQGLTLFDLPPAQVHADMAQWKPILEWLAPVLCPAPPAHGADVPSSRPRAATAPARPATAPSAVAKAGPAKPASLESLERHGKPRRAGGLLAWLTLPRFLQRKRSRRAFARSEL